MCAWDAIEAQTNLAKHGVAFADGRNVDWDTAEVIPDVRLDYGEQGCIALGLIGDRVHVVIYTERCKRHADPLLPLTI